jgi:hypothetical protein
MLRSSASLRIEREMRKSHCRLTGESGKFVEAHILPRALTKPALAGRNFIQFGEGKRPIRRWSSWYDRELVTCEGEKILSGYDDWAIAELRRLKLVWQSWGPMISLSTGDSIKVDSSGYGLRQLRCSDPDKLRLFFLSLLWRAAATTRPEFREIQLGTDHLEHLRIMVRDGNPRPLDFYPTTLLQIASMGPTHNFAPIAMDDMVDIGNGVTSRQYVFRFYFDGLVARMLRPIEGVDRTKGIESLVVGSGPTLVVQTQPLVGSFQIDNLNRVIVESQFRWPEATGRLTSVPGDQIGSDATGVESKRS